MGAVMKVSRWGNSLAVRLPADLVRQMGLKEGDQISQETFALRKLTHEEAMRRIRAAKWELPEDYKFDRDDANSR